MIGLAHLDAGNFGNGIPFIGRFQRPCKQVFFLYWLRRHFGVYTGRTKEEQLFTIIAISRINDIRLDDAGNYVVEYETFEFIEELPGVHIHFFFDTVPPKEAGSPGSGPWKLYGGPRPFTGYRQNQRPEDATQLCSLVANPDHSVQPESGTCFNLPDVALASAFIDTNCLLGPDPEFSSSSTLIAGQPLRVLGISPDEKWWVVVHPTDPDETCWLSQDNSSISGDISTLGLIEPPPIPEMPVRSVEITGRLA